MNRLGFAPVLIAATGGPTNPVGIAVTIGAGVAVVVSKFLNVGAGRKEADYLTDPQAGAQTHAGQALARVVDTYAAHPELWTRKLVDGVIQAIEKIRDDFVSYAAQFTRAGPGAIETIESLCNRLIADRRREREALPPETIEGERLMKPVRLFLVSPPGTDGVPYARVDTGVVGGTSVDPIAFATVEDLYHYARTHGELVYQVQSAEEAYAIADGERAIPEGSEPPLPGEESAVPWYVWAGLAYAGKVLLLG